RGRAPARAVAARRQALHDQLERRARRSDAHRILDGARARAFSRARERPRQPDARRQHCRRRQHDHVAHQANPTQISSDRSLIRLHRYRVRHRLSLASGRGLTTMRIALGIRAQLLLVLTVFLVLPWLGYEYVRELERFLRDAQERTVAGTAQAVATALHDRARLFENRSATPELLAVERRSDETLATASSAQASETSAPPSSPDIEQIIHG